MRQAMSVGHSIRAALVASAVQPVLLLVLAALHRRPDMTEQLVAILNNRLLSLPVLPAAFGLVACYGRVYRTNPHTASFWLFVRRVFPLTFLLTLAIPWLWSTAIVEAILRDSDQVVRATIWVIIPSMTVLAVYLVVTAIRETIHLTWTGLSHTHVVVGRAVSRGPGGTLDLFARFLRPGTDSRASVEASAADLRKEVRAMRKANNGRRKVLAVRFWITTTTILPIVWDGSARVAKKLPVLGGWIRVVSALLRKLDPPTPG